MARKKGLSQIVKWIYNRFFLKQLKSINNPLRSDCFGSNFKAKKTFKLFKEGGNSFNCSTQITIKNKHKRISNFIAAIEVLHVFERSLIVLQQCSAIASELFMVLKRIMSTFGALGIFWKCLQYCDCCIPPCNSNSFLVFFLFVAEELLSNFKMKFQSFDQFSIVLCTKLNENGFLFSSGLSVKKFDELTWYLFAQMMRV